MPISVPWGFRGEALSSIAAVTQTELITKTEEEELGTRYVIEGGKEISIEETGAPDGTTFLVRQLFLQCSGEEKISENSHDRGRACAGSAHASGTFPSGGCIYFPE